LGFGKDEKGIQIPINLKGLKSHLLN